MFFKDSSLVLKGITVSLSLPCCKVLTEESNKPRNDLDPEAAGPLPLRLGENISGGLGIFILDPMTLSSVLNAQRVVLLLLIQIPNIKDTVVSGSRIKRHAGKTEAQGATKQHIYTCHLL